MSKTTIGLIRFVPSVFAFSRQQIHAKRHTPGKKHHRANAKRYVGTKRVAHGSIPGSLGTLRVSAFS
jgi:hypothetical protein